MSEPRFGAKTNASYGGFGESQPHESNYLLNPAHPDFKKITLGKPELFSFDPRLLL
jgi:hypothetical protein